jgi:hypothetical protein
MLRDNQGIPEGRSSGASILCARRRHARERWWSQ